MSNRRKATLSKSEDSKDLPGNIKSLMKAISVLEAFRGRERYLSLAEIAAITGLDKSSVQRCTRTLRETGYLEQNQSTRRYAIGRRVLDLSFEYLRSNPLIERAAPILVDLRQAARERVDLSILDDTDLVYVFRLQSKRDAFSAALVGRRVPVYCTAGGRAIMSHMPDNEVRQILARSDLKRRTPRTIIEIEALMREIHRVRSNGYSIQAEEWRPGEIVAAAAVIDAYNRPVGAVHIAGSIAEWSPEEFERRMGPLVAVAASEVSEHNNQHSFGRDGFDRAAARSKVGS